MQSPDFGSKGARSARSSRLRPMNSALPGQNLLQGVSPVKRIRPTMLLLFTGILIVLVFFGAQLKVPTVAAFPFYSFSNVTVPATNTCATAGCHSGTVTSGGNTVITVSPSTMTYTPGSTTPIQLSVNVTDAASTRTTWGYILTARLTNSPSSQAGSWTLIDANSSIAPNALSPSILDLKAATYASSTWTFEWTPPPAGTTDSVTFYLTGLAVNPLIVPIPTDTGMYQSTLTLMPPPPTVAPSITSSTNTTFTAGTAGTFTVTATGTPAPTFSETGALPGGVTFSTAGVLSGTATVSGTFPITFTAANGTLPNATQSFTLTVNPAPAPNFSLSASPSSLTQGGSGSSTITVTPQNGFTGSVALSVSGLPSGVTASTFNPASTTSTSVLTLTASSTAATGTFPLTITGTSGTLSHTATLSLTVNAPAPAPNFSLSASPYTLTQGSNGTSTITVTPQNGFTGSVALSVSGLPSGVTASSFNPASTASTSVLTLTASSTAATGTHSVMITGTSGMLTHTATLTLTVNSTISTSPMVVSPTSLTFKYQSGGS